MRANDTTSKWIPDVKRVYRSESRKLLHCRRLSIPRTDPDEVEVCR
jgi:hypothetical protein